MQNGHVICDADGEQLDAKFLVDTIDGQLTVVIGSSGAGTTTLNLDYDEALRLILFRLGEMEAVLLRAEVASSHTDGLPPAERQVAIDEYSVPLLLSSVEDCDHLRKKITSGAAKTARTPGAKGGGNPRKRLRLFLAFTKGWRPNEDELTAIIRRGNGAVPRPGQVHAAEDRPISYRKPSGQTGQGFEPDPAVRKAVEEYAVRAAMEFYEKAEWTVQRVDHEYLGYDLQCVKGQDQLFVEVKGTRGEPERVILTRNEVEHAHKNSGATVLFILHSIEVQRSDGDPPRCSGGKEIIFLNWDPHVGDRLKVKDYYWYLPDT